MRVTKEEALTVACPTCGAKPGVECELVSRQPRTQPHRDRRLEVLDQSVARRAFDPATFLSTTGTGRQVVSFQKGETVFVQGDTADAVFVMLEGRTRLSAQSKNGKEATLRILGDRDMFGKDCIAGEQVRTASATAMTDCTLLRIEKKIMVRALAREISLSNLLWVYVLGQNMRYEQDLVDQRCNPSEKRLARILLLLAQFDGLTTEDALIPNISHGTLAEMVGTTRSRVCFFMKRFKVSGFIDYKGSREPMRICRSLIAFQAS